MKLNIVLLFIVIIVVYIVYKRYTRNEQFNIQDIDPLKKWLIYTSGILCSSQLDSTGSKNYNYKGLCKRIIKENDFNRLGVKLLDSRPNKCRKHKFTLPGGRIFNYFPSPHGFTKKANLSEDHSGSYTRVIYGNKEACKDAAIKDENVTGFYHKKYYNKCVLTSNMKNNRRKYWWWWWATDGYIKSGGAQFTVSFWINIKNSAPVDRRLFLATSSKGDKCPEIILKKNDTGIRFTCTTAESGEQSLDIESGAISMNRWTNITTTVYNKDIRHYVDGQLISELELNSELNPMLNINFQLGMTDNRQYIGTLGNIEMSNLLIFSLAVPQSMITSYILNDYPTGSGVSCNAYPIFCTDNGAKLSATSNQLSKDNTKDIQNRDYTDESRDIAGQSNFPGKRSENRGISQATDNPEYKSTRSIQLSDLAKYDEESGLRRPISKYVNNFTQLSGTVVFSGNSTLIGAISKDVAPDKSLIFPRLAGKSEMLEIRPNGDIQRITNRRTDRVSLDGIFFSKYEGSPIDLSMKRLTRYIKITQPRSTYLSLAEVKIYNRAGENINKRGLATQSSTAYGGNAQRAVDDNTSSKWSDGSITHTNYGSSNWWKIDLGQGSEISRIEVYNRKDSGTDGRIAGIKIELVDRYGETISSKVWSMNDYKNTGNTQRTKNGAWCKNWNVAKNPKLKPWYYNYRINMRKPTPWKCYSGFSAPIRRNRYGHIECMGKITGKDKYGRVRYGCVVGNRGSCNSKLRSDTGKNLTCGNQHQRMYGFNGYNSSGHWCSKMDKLVSSGDNKYIDQSKYPNRGLGYHNKCRDPDKKGHLWCYTYQGEGTWDYCANPENGKLIKSCTGNDCLKIYPRSKTFHFSTSGKVPTGWKHYGDKHRKASVTKANGNVYLSGVIYYSKGVWKSGNIIGVLHGSFIPSRDIVGNATNKSGTTRILINTKGQLIPLEGSNEIGTGRGDTNKSWVSLDGISWPISTSTSMVLSNNWISLGSGHSGRNIKYGRILFIPTFNGNGYNTGYSLGNNPKFRNDSSQTISMFLNPIKNGRQTPITKASSGEGAIVLESNGYLNYYYGNSGNNYGRSMSIHSGKPIPFGKLTHVALVRGVNYRRYTTLKWYINGVLTNEKTYNISPRSGNNELSIGKGRVRQYKGTIKNLMLYNRILVKSEIEFLSRMTSSTGNRYGSATITKNGQLITLSGIISLKNVGSNPNGSTITRLPVNYRPNKKLIFYVNSNIESTEISILDSGEVTISNGNVNDFISLDGIQFITYK